MITKRDAEFHGHDYNPDHFRFRRSCDGYHPPRAGDHWHVWRTAFWLGYAVCALWALSVIIQVLA